MSHKRKKITIIGSGFVGSSCAHWILSKDLADVVLIDINEGLAKGRALDLLSASPVNHSHISIQGGSDYKLSANSDVVIITAGIPRKPGMSRQDLLKTNAKIMKNISEQLKIHTANSIFIVVSNPIDAMVSLAHNILQIPREKILGMAGILDTARFKTFIAQSLNCCVKDIQALVLGGHGDSMLPLLDFCTVGSIPLRVLMDKNTQASLVDRTRKGGAEIVSLLKTGSAHYAPAIAAVEMAESILKDQKRILPCHALLQGEFEEQGIFLGVPCQLGAKGLEKIIEVPLNPEEQNQFKKSANIVKKLLEDMKGLLT